MITVLTGSNSFGLKAELDRLVNEFMKTHGEMAIERIDGEEAEFDRIRESLESMPFLATNKLVVLRTPSANKQFVDQAENLLGNLSETTEVIIIEPKLDKRLAYYKYLKKSTEFSEFNDLDEYGLSRWLVDEAKKQGGSISQPDAKYLINRIGPNQQQLANELSKLLTYDTLINRQVIDLLTEAMPQSTIFELIDAAFAGNMARATQIYQEQRSLKVEPQQIMAMIAWQLHVLAIIKTAGKKSVEEVSREAKLNPFVVRKGQSIANKMTVTELKVLIQRTLALDVRLKSESINADDALQQFLLSISL